MEHTKECLFGIEHAKEYDATDKDHPALKEENFYFPDICLNG